VDRAQFLLQGIDRETSYGAEIGPFYAPIAPKALGWHTTVVDFTHQQGLLDTARNHSATAIRDMACNIETVDVVWRDVRLDEACLRLRPEGFDYLIASHVIEHFYRYNIVFATNVYLGAPGLCVVSRRAGLPPVV
jgi:hypothetical protein